ncbi:hypothetical protein FNJ88_13425 [Chryseobacterium sp. SNU WT5]|uniref:hypothetical protein n=1 Tax=Chryseobacterium sp. SNU WT5 TaxID=2594269 RepID=UPI001180F597|nr:hypothetical protein [Chryseobacterium sp. SNU WT5]QDP86504.1 hypothetical protein FNJ88_13425 [Chryseobacterium sp. SNU WT5]
MEKIKIYDYYSFGYNYYILLNEETDKTNIECLEDLKKYTSFLKRLDLRVTTSSIKLNQLVPEMEKLQKLAKVKKTRDQKIEPVFWKSIVAKLKKVDLTLDAELNTKIAYLLDEKRFSNEILTGKIYQLFSKGTFVLLPDIAKFDFEESGQCLAFDRYTACAFHSLRGTEDVIKMYYEKLCSKTATDRDTWGTFETAIIKSIGSGLITPVPDEQLIINISSLRKYYRNKTQHPQNTYTSDETQDLLSLCIKTINEIMHDLQKRKLI